MESDEREAIRVLIVDDHDLFRTGLSSLLSAEADIEVVAQASGGRRGVRLAAELRPDVVLMDLQMPDLHGVDAIRAIVDHDPKVPVLALSIASDDADVARALGAGACGYLSKESSADDLIAAVRATAHGAAWLSAGAAETVLHRIRSLERPSYRTEPEPDTQVLSARELDVLRLVAQGMENAEIAERLSMSPRTAKNHVSSILSKLGLSNRIQAATWAVRAGLH